MLGRLLALLALVFATSAATPSPSPAPGSGSAAALAAALAAAKTIPYDRLTEAGTAQHGLFTIWHYNGQVLLELKKDQLDKDFVELGVPVNGIGGEIFAGSTDLQPVRIVRFERHDDKIAIVFPSTRFLADPNSAVANAVAVASAPTVVGVAAISSKNEKDGSVVFDISSLLQDVTGVGDVLTDINGGERNPMATYRLDVLRSIFGQTKAFPDNVVIDVEQTFATLQPNAGVLSVTPDARSLQMTVQYNIAELPPDDGYMPRLYDDRVGYFVNAHQDFSSDNTYDNSRYYIVRWNLARKPIVYYLSNTIPEQYRDPIRKALLTWNAAFARLRIQDAVEVKDQPADPSFDPDDIRYNVVRWLAEVQGGFAEAQLLYNPYTGEMIKSGIVIDSDLMRLGKFQYPTLVAPARAGDDDDASAAGHVRSEAFDGAAYADDERQNYNYGALALGMMGDGNYPRSPAFADQFLESIVLHESGHDFGLRHNFMGSEAYTARDLQSASFTARSGISSSVMEYSPVNLWPKGTRQGAYYQTVLGPYDYYAIKWGYAPIAGARTPDAELPTLRAWASRWSDPQFTYSSDEDVSWTNGAAVDPRNQQWDLTDDNIGWCGMQMKMMHGIIGRVDRRFPQAQLPFDDLRFAFSTVVRQYGRCSQIVSRYLGGEYISRSLRGDPHEALPLTAIPIATQKRAFDLLEQNVFSAAAWNFSPDLLRQLVTQYRYDDWLGNFPPRHDLAIEQLASGYQISTIARLYNPVTLQRLDDIDMKYPAGTTMDLGDLFTWMQSAIYGDVRPGAALPLVRRNLQRNYAALLSKLANSPPAGTPDDAQALARYELGQLRGTIASGLRGQNDLLTRAHLEAMDADVARALDAHYVIDMR
jgi:hypothetical protein